MTATGAAEALGKASIAALIPHTGAMCLLHSVRYWDSTTIVCMASSHHDADNPMASGGRLDSLCGIEYAAQAMAVHAGLTAAIGRRPRAGYLASVRDVVRSIGRLDLLADDLEVTATLLGSGPAGALYGFALRGGDVTLLSGRAAVVIDADAMGARV